MRSSLRDATPTLTRRHLLALTGAALLPACMTSRAEPTPMIVDTHVHCFAEPTDARFPVHPRGTYHPTAAATPEHLLACLDGAGIARAILVHAEPYQDDHRWLEHCLTVTRGRTKGTYLFFADDPGAPAALTALAKRAPLVAARVHAYAPERLPPFSAPGMRALWRAAADAGLAMQLHFEPRWAPGFAPLIDEFRSTTVIIDHLGRPSQGTPDEHQVVVRWADKPNTIVKVSALSEVTQYPHRDQGPAIRALTAAYGAGRMIWGGSFAATSTPASTAADIDRARRALAHLSRADQDQILGGTAARVFGFSA
jgi:predicted TIM-barrel fold metal-dependent hydrolase